MRKGARYEDLAEAYLRKKGYRILERNFHCRGGEIDIVALDGETLVFVEVKGGRDLSYGDPLERVGRLKLLRILRCGRLYSAKSGNRSFRIDVVVVRGNEVEHLENIGFS